MSTEQIESLHNEAMSFADDADLMKQRGDLEQAKELFKIAFMRERDAAMSAIESGVDNLSANVLIKSAAFLAFDAGLIRESEQMVGLSLSRDLQEDIAEEMRDLLENIHFSRHLRLNGVTLSDNEVQIVVAGNGVANGMAREDDVNERLNTFKQLAVRTAERHKRRAFRTKGQPAKDIKDLCTSYLTVARAASFAVTMRIGQTSGGTLDSFQGETNALIEDIATNLSLVNNGDISTLRTRITDQSYLENFISLAKEFAPDGERINLVGLTFKKGNQEIPMELKTPKKQYRGIVAAIDENSEGGETIRQTVMKTLMGTLYAADSTSNIVRLQANAKKISISVPDGLTEIVRKYFDTEVSAMVSYDKRNKTYRLVSIDPRGEEPQLF